MRRLGINLMSAIVAFVVSAVLVACSPPGSDRATQVFADCLERNGITAEKVEVTLGSNGSVATISASILSEGDVAYEPTIRLACTEEVELSQ